MPALALILNALVWGLSWFPFRQMEVLGLHPVWATTLIYAVIFAVMGIVRWRLWRAFAAQPALLLLGLAAGATNVGFNWAVTLGDVVRVVLLFYLMPLWSALLAWALLGERPTPGVVARMALALTGVAVVLKTPEVAWPLPASLPDWLALAAGFCFAATNILLRGLRHSPGEARALAMFGGATLIGGATALAGTALGAFTPPALVTPGWIGWAVLLGTAFFAANICLQYGAARLAANATAVIMLSEVLFASGSSALLGASVLSPRLWTGGALIVVAAVWSAFARSAGQDDDDCSPPLCKDSP